MKFKTLFFVVIALVLALPATAAVQTSPTGATVAPAPMMIVAAKVKAKAKKPAAAKKVAPAPKAAPAPANKK